MNGLWQNNGELWTDPRNTNFFGGIYHAAAKLHAAKGGYDIALHWNALGGYGVLQWYPDYNVTVPYYSWRYLIETADIVPGSVLVEAITDEIPKADILHMNSDQTDCYTVQPFAIKTEDDRIRVILINKHADDKDILIDTPPGMNHYKLFRFDADRIEIANDMISCDGTEDSLQVTCPGMSVTVIQYGPEMPVSVSEIALPNDTRIIGNYPNPFNPRTIIRFQLSADSFVELSVFDVSGRRINILLNEKRKKGTHSIHFNAGYLPAGTYLLRLTAGNDVDVKTIMLIK